MQRFWWPGYETRLLEQLQRQQNSTQFCDTLLQTDGISVPAHSCVLAALSPYLSQRLSASLSPPSEQKRRLHLRALSAQTLLKLVRLLYSGELEVRSSKEQNEVLAAAHRFGITDLELGCKDREGGGTELLEVRQRVHMGEMHKRVKTQDAQVQAEIIGKIEDDPVERRSFASVGTQTVGDVLTSGPGPVSAPAKPPAAESASVVGTFSTSQPKNITQISLTSDLSVHRDPEAPAERSPSSRRTETAATSLSPDASSTSLQKENQHAEAEQDMAGQQDGNRKATVDGADSAPLRVCREKMLTEGQEKKKSHFIRQGKNLEKMKQTKERMETAKISIKVKLRRGTRGDRWETVSVRDEAVSVLSTLTQKTPQTGLDVLQTPAPSALAVQNPELQKVQHVLNFSPKHANTSSFSEASSNCGWMDHSSELEPESLSPPQSPVDESDEQIDKMLEGIMRSLNFLPDPNRNCKKTQADRDVAQTFHQVPATENNVGPTTQDADVGAARGGSYQNLETQGVQSHADTGVHYFGAENQPNLAGPSVRTCQHQPPGLISSIVSCGRMNGSSSSGAPTRCPLPVARFSSGAKLHYQGFQHPSSQEDQSVQFLPQPHEGETNMRICMDDLRLPMCLSPLKPSHSEAPAASALPWLGGSACTLQLPLNTIAMRDDAPQPAETTAESEDRKYERVKRREEKNHDAAEDAPPPKRRRGRPPGSQKEPKGSASSRGRKTKSLHSEALSHATVSVKKREKKINRRGSAARIMAPQSAKLIGAGNLSGEHARIRTRGFMKRSEQNGSSTVSDRCCVLIPPIRRVFPVQKQDPVPPRRRRGRPRKIKPEEKTPEAPGPRADIRVQREAGGKEEKQTEKEEKKTCRMLISAASSREQLRKSDEGPGENGTANMGSSQTKKPSLMETLKEFQKLIKWKHSKTRQGSEAPDRRESKAVDLEEVKVSEAEDGSEMEKNGDTKIPHSFDENHILLTNTSEDQCGPAGPDRTEASETSKGGAMFPCNRGDDGSSTLSCCDEENDEDEVDVMLYSPEKGSSTREVEERVIVVPDDDEDEEEEDDVDEIDVTGDEE